MGSTPPIYLVRQLSKSVYEVTKWEEWGGKRPDAIYRIEKYRWDYICDCPAGKHHIPECKHVAILERWLLEGKPVAIPIVVGLGPWGWGL